ncbi:unnamed protein product [Malus baccata var. baccata]
MLVEKGPKRVNDVAFPKDNSGRLFSFVHYIRKLPNGETQDRKWLVYSCSFDILFCFCCNCMKRIIDFFLNVIEMIAEFDPAMQYEVKSEIIARIREAKYFSVILDCTPDASHEDQMSLIIRCVDVTKTPIKVEEFFLEFLNVHDSTGCALFDVLLGALSTLKLDVDDIRGQGYDNGSNMKGKNKGVQSRKSHIESVKPIRESAQQIRDDLIHLENTSEDSKSKSEAKSLAIHGLENFEFSLGMVIWHELLFAINTVSKTLQKEDMHIDVAIDQLKGLISVLDQYRETGFKEAMNEAKKIASEMEIEPVFREKRIIQRKKQFDESASEVATQSAIEARTSLHIRFEQFHKYEETFGLLFNLKKLKDVDNDSLKSFCINLQEFLKHGEHSDIDGKDLFIELRILRETLPNEINRAMEVLKYIRQMDGCFPNAWVAYRILLTIPVTIVSAERSFSKLKLIKSYLRSTMSQEKLNGLAILSIKKELVEKLDYVNLINTFASKNARRVIFK